MLYWLCHRRAGKFQAAVVIEAGDLSRHRSVDTLRAYVRDAEIFKDHAGTGLL